jgi:hypothetical protein
MANPIRTLESLREEKDLLDALLTFYLENKSQLGDMGYITPVMQHYPPKLVSSLMYRLEAVSEKVFEASLCGTCGNELNDVGGCGACGTPGGLWLHIEDFVAAFVGPFPDRAAADAHVALMRERGDGAVVLGVLTQVEKDEHSDVWAISPQLDRDELENHTAS